ncbi:hypothetical protein [Rugamonas aquatica]|uniref:Uncharacterized protein n=1 Tax=Rugamonas aquatica TaxID=2743357 RepID=A0A6A7N043_9BURK|nr:hypothetical protein [Rugamonas aquatica]MQA38396.1 hypothetical protein [Rugamonas aquatica]
MARIAKKVAAKLAASKSSELIDIPAVGIVIREDVPTAQHLVRVRAEGKRAVIAIADVPAEPGTPVFSIDPHDAKLVIRRLDGQVVRGYFKDGKFVKV